MLTDSFRFKQFGIEHHPQVLKVTTDACLLGAWAFGQGASGHCLDVGCGTGLLSLMLAQRFPQLACTGIDVSEEAIQICKINFANSPWANRLQAHLADATLLQGSGTYSHIIANPPFYAHGMASPRAGQALATHQLSLTPTALASLILKLLKPDGQVAILYPPQQANEIEKLLKNNGLDTLAKVIVHAHPGKPAMRHLLLLGKGEACALGQVLYIRDASGQYTKPFASLLAPFYLHL